MATCAALAMSRMVVSSKPRSRNNRSAANNMRERVSSPLEVLLACSMSPQIFNPDSTALRFDTPIAIRHLIAIRHPHCDPTPHCDSILHCDSTPHSEPRPQGSATTTVLPCTLAMPYSMGQGSRMRLLNADPTHPGSVCQRCRAGSPVESWNYR